MEPRASYKRLKRKGRPVTLKQMMPLFAFLFSMAYLGFRVCEDSHPAIVDLISLPEPGPNQFFFANAVTKIVLPNHTDPNYTDVCYRITREVCDFCCLIDFEFCSRDIGICMPVSDRKLGSILDCVIVFGGILCGFPIIIRCCSCFISYRCCP